MSEKIKLLDCWNIKTCVANQFDWFVYDGNFLVKTLQKFLEWWKTLVIFKTTIVDHLKYWKLKYPLFSSGHGQQIEISGAVRTQQRSRIYSEWFIISSFIWRISSIKTF